MSEKRRVTVPESAIRPDGSMAPPYDKLLERGAKLIDAQFNDSIGVLYLFEVEKKDDGNENKTMRKL